MQQAVYIRARHTVVAIGVAHDLLGRDQRAFAINGNPSPFADEWHMIEAKPVMRGKMFSHAHIQIACIAPAPAVKLELHQCHFALFVLDEYPAAVAQPGVVDRYLQKLKVAASLQRRARIVPAYSARKRARLDL